MSSSEFKQNQVVITNNFITREYKGYSIFFLRAYISTFPEKNILESPFLPSLFHCKQSGSPVFHSPRVSCDLSCDSLLSTENPAPTIDYKS